MTYKKPREFNIEAILIFFLVIDLFFGGGGRVFTIGSISIRQVIFSLIVLLSIYGFFLNKTFIRINKMTVIIYLLITSFAISAFTGVMNGHDFGLILEDISPLLFFLMYFPFYNYFIIKNKQVNPIFKILKLSGFIISILTIAMYFIAQTGYFLTMYTFFSEQFGTEFMFRPNGGVFFKGLPFTMFSLFLCYASMLKKEGKYNLIVGVLCLVSILSSGTRGLIYTMVLGLLLISLVYWKELFRYIFKRFILLIPIGIFVTSKLKDIISPERLQFSSLGVDPGVQLRIGFMNDVTEILNNNPILGGGFGTEINLRSSHLEMSFLDILMEQGFLGLAIWGLLILYIFSLFIQLRQLKAFKTDPVVVSLLASFCTLLIFTNTNPFINNPIGISFIIIVVITLTQKINIKKELYKQKEVA